MGARPFSSSAFSPAAPRQTSVCLLRNSATGDHRLVTSISTRKTTEVLCINLRTGRLELVNDTEAESSYENESEALDQLQSRGFEVAERGYALLGYVAAGAFAGALLATRVREKAVLPGGHTVYAVTDSQWALVPLQNESADAAAAAALAGLPPPKADADFWRAVQQFTLNNAHYYCETADVSRPFPSDRDPRDPAPEFVWNTWLRKPLCDLGLYEHCPALLQGAVECSTQQLPGAGSTSGRFSMCLISRRSRRHPGTRYIARGLNGLAGPGNEIECELITWTHPEQQYTGSYMPSGGSFSAGSSRAAHSGGPQPLHWARVVWRRGTVPIWWGVQLQSLAQGLQAEVYVREEQPYQGTASYFRSVQQQHVPRPALPRPASGVQQQEQQQQQQGAEGGAAAAAAAAGGEGWTLVEGATGASDGAAGVGPGGQQGGAGQSRGAAAAGAAAAGGDEAASLHVPVTCINLLHANPKKASELMLSSHFQDAMRHVRRRLGAEAPIKVVNFDWHGNMGKLTEEKAVEGFWSLIEPFVKQTGFASGWMEAAPDRASPRPAGGSSDSGGGAQAPAARSAATPSTSWPPGWRMLWSRQQSGLLRFNCADSLDRTNAATCFAMLPVLQEQLRVLGLALECAVPTATAALLRSRQRSSASDIAALAPQQQAGQLEAEVSAAAALPEGWEVRQHEGRLLYIDHVNKTTQWAPPSPAAPGGRRPSSAGLSSRMMQSASDMLSRLQQRSSGPGNGGGGGGSRSAALLNLERRSSPPRATPDREGGGPPHHGRTPSAGSLGGGLSGVPHAASAPDFTLVASRASTAASEVPAAPSAPERDPLRPWAFFGYDIGDVRERLAREAVGDYVEMFRVHGDIHSFLYTGSPAMHSHVLNLVVQGGKGYGAVSGVGKLQNLRVAVQRRWNNTVSDASRQQAMELFLGLRIHDSGAGQKGYFPGLQLAYTEETQAALGGIDAFEHVPLPPAPHSRHTSLLPAGAAAGALGLLASGAPAADAAALALAAAGLEQQEGSLALHGPLLEETDDEQAAAQPPAPQQQQQAWEEEDDNRGHLVPGAGAAVHDGVVGVRQSLLDLEPLPECDLLLGGDPGMQPQHLHGSSGPSSVSVASHGSRSLSSEGPGDAPPAAFDPLGALPHPSPPPPPQQGPAELISFDDADVAPPAAPATLPAPSGSSAPRMQDLSLI